MKLLGFADLDPVQQEKVVNDAKNAVLQGIVEGLIVFEDSVQRNVDQAIKYANDVMRTPWFAHEYVMDKIGDVIRDIAKTHASVCLYAPNDAPEIVRL